MYQMYQSVLKKTNTLMQTLHFITFIVTTYDYVSVKNISDVFERSKLLLDKKFDFS